MASYPSRRHSRAEPRTHRRNDHGVFRFNHLVHNAVRESHQVTPSDVPRLVPTTMEQRIFCQSIPNANNSLNKIRPRTGCLHHTKRLPRPRPAPFQGGTLPATSFGEARTKSCFHFLQQNSGTGGRAADSPQVATPPGIPAQISDPLRNIQVDTYAVSKIAKKLAIRRLAAHFPAGSELD